MTPPLQAGGMYRWTYQSEFFVGRFGVLANAFVAYSIEDRVICALDAFDGWQRISSGDAPVGRGAAPRRGLSAALGSIIAVDLARPLGRRGRGHVWSLQRGRGV